MRLLLDTNVALWWVVQPARIPKDVYAKLEDRRNEVVVSVVSIWEIGLKQQTGRLSLTPEALVDAIPYTGFRLLEISASHAIAVGKLPQHHKDPFDRMLIAQSKIEALRIVTADYTFDKYDCDPIFV